MPTVTTWAPLGGGPARSVMAAEGSMGWRSTLAAARLVRPAISAAAASAQCHGLRMKIPCPPVETGYAKKSKELKRFWGFGAGTRSLYPASESVAAAVLPDRNAVPI